MKNVVVKTALPQAMRKAAGAYGVPAARKLVR